MAIMSCVIHKACRAVVPPALRTITSPRIPFPSLIMTTESFSHRRHFSTATPTSDGLKKVDKELIKTITNSQFKSSKPFDFYNIQMPEAPRDFPFEIEDDVNELGIKLKREYAGEKIVVEVYDPIYPDNWRCKINDEENGFSFDKPRVQVTMRITKLESGAELAIHLWANVGYVGHPEIFLDSERLPDEMSFEQEEYWREFIGKRGIDDSIGKYMMNYMNWRSARKYLLFWGKVRDFLDE